MARTRAEVPVRSSAVSATSENGVSWWISRTVSPPPRPVSGCCRQLGGAAAAGRWSSPGTPVTAHGSSTTVAAIAVNRIDGAGRRHGTDDVTYVSVLPVFRHGNSADQNHLQRHRRACWRLLRCRSVAGLMWRGATRRARRRLRRPVPLRRAPLPRRRLPVRPQRRRRCTRGLDRRHDRGHHHALEQVDRLAGAQLVGRAGQIAEQAAAAREPPGWRPATDRPGSGRCPAPGPVRSVRRSASRRCSGSPAVEIGATPRPGSVSAGGVVRPGVLKPGSVSDGVVSPGVLTPGAVSPGAASAGSVSDGVVKPGVVSPGAAPAGLVRPGVVSAGLASPGSVSDGIPVSPATGPERSGRRLPTRGRTWSVRMHRCR